MKALYITKSSLIVLICIGHSAYAAMNNLATFIEKSVTTLPYGFATQYNTTYTRFCRSQEGDNSRIQLEQATEKSAFLLYIIKTQPSGYDYQLDLKEGPKPLPDGFVPLILQPGMHGAQEHFERLQEEYLAQEQDYQSMFHRQDS